MRRFRNPRYAPESLERKLSPSGFAPPPADVSVVETPAAPSTSSSSCDYWSYDPMSEPGDPNYGIYSGDPSSQPPGDLSSAVSPGDPPDGDPGYPADPDGPAYSGS